MDQQDGISLLETLLAMALTLLLMGFALGFGIFSFGRFKHFEQKIELQQQTRIGLEMLLAELKIAGLGMPQSQATILSMTPSSLSFRSNLKNVHTLLTADTLIGGLHLSVKNGLGFKIHQTVLICKKDLCEEGILNNPGRKTHLTLKEPLATIYPIGSTINQINLISYYLNQKKQLLRKVDRGGPNEVASKIKKLHFLYLDQKSRPTIDPSAVRHVRVTLVTQNKKGNERTFSSSVGIRNR